MFHLLRYADPDVELMKFTTLSKINVFVRLDFTLLMDNVDNVNKHNFTFVLNKPVKQNAKITKFTVCKRMVVSVEMNTI